jgi:hypothetical protein
MASARPAGAQGGHETPVRYKLAVQANESNVAEFRWNAVKGC